MEKEITFSFFLTSDSLILVMEVLVVEEEHAAADGVRRVGVWGRYSGAVYGAKARMRRWGADEAERRTWAWGAARVSSFFGKCLVG
ncbi:hypothetical protein GOBAR_DD03538 [Gossypium barbadense]|nr:hypothetical protein GOBAR_DD03538 [Gossypium barbadense]